MQLFQNVSSQPCFPKTFSRMCFPMASPLPGHQNNFPLPDLILTQRYNNFIY